MLVYYSVHSVQISVFAGRSRLLESLESLELAVHYVHSAYTLHTLHRTLCVHFTIHDGWRWMMLDDIGWHLDDAGWRFGWRFGWCWMKFGWHFGLRLDDGWHWMTFWMTLGWRLDDFEDFEDLFEDLDDMNRLQYTIRIHDLTTIHDSHTRFAIHESHVSNLVRKLVCKFSSTYVFSTYNSTT